MRLGTFKRIFKTDYPTENQPLVEKLAGSINIGFESLFNAFANNISLNDNIACTVKTIQVAVTSGGIPKGIASFNVNTSGQLTGISVLKAINLTRSTTYPTSAPFISYTQNDKSVSIVNITGLSANDNWALTVVAWV